MMKGKIVLMSLFLLVSLLPNQVRAQEPSFFFIQISDTQLGFADNNKSISAEVESFRTVIKTINRMKPPFVIITGDFVHDPVDGEQIATFKRLVAEIDPSVKVYMVPGNHDMGKVDKESMERYQKNYGDTRFSFQYGDCAFIGIDSNIIKEEDAEREAAQFEWLERELKKVERLPLKFVFTHCPIILKEMDEPVSYSNFPLSMRDKYIRLLQKYQVDAVFAGHLHNNAYAKVGDMELVTIGPVAKALNNGYQGINVVKVFQDRYEYEFIGLDKLEDNFMFGIDNFGDRYPDTCFFNRKVMDALGMDFVIHHWPTPKGSVADEEKRAAALGKAFEEAGLKVIVNAECGNFNKEITTQEGFDWVNRPNGLHLFRFPESVLKRLGESPAVWGVQYDELEHTQLTRNLSITIEHRDVEMATLAETTGMDFKAADAAVADGARSLVSEVTAHGIPAVYTEHVWPVLFHNFARAGMTPVYKQMKENWSNVWAACAMGAALQYNRELWSCIDLWHYNSFPGHSAETLKANLQFAYWAGVDKAYVEAIGDHTYEIVDGDFDNIRFKERGEVLRDFSVDYVQSNPRPYTFRDFLPQIAIVRFDDTAWGQGPEACCPVPLEDGSIYQFRWEDRLFGAYNLRTSPESEEWIKAWHTITHGEVSRKSLSWNAVSAYGEKPYRCFAPANMPVVYDEQVRKEHLQGVKLLFLCGLLMEERALTDIAALVKEEGLTVVTSPRFAPQAFRDAYTSGVQCFEDSRGKWILTDDMAHDDLKREVAPWLGKKDEIVMRFKGGHKVTMKISTDGNSLSIIKD